MASYAANYFPPGSFYFRVELDGSGTAIDNQFQEISGLEVEQETTDIKEGGLNDFVHRVPVRIKYNNLVLKRGLAVIDSDLVSWIQERLHPELQLTGRVETRDLRVILMDEKRNDIRSWSFTRAYPVKWSVSNLNAQESSIAIETIEFSYQSYNVV